VTARKTCHRKDGEGWWQDYENHRSNLVSLVSLNVLDLRLHRDCVAADTRAATVSGQPVQATPQAVAGSEIIQMTTYNITFSCDSGNVFPQVGDMLKRVNAEMSILGYSEKLGVRSKMIRATLTSERELTKEERERVKKTLIQQFTASQPAWKVKVESFRRQSGNVQQLAS
jgi:hypothetical protein